METKDTVQYLANPDVSCRIEGPDEGAILFNPDSDAILIINPTGLLLWEALQEPLVRDDLVDHLRQRCDGVPEDQVAGDVESFLQSLQPGGFIGTVLPEESA